METSQEFTPEQLERYDQKRQKSRSAAPSWQVSQSRHELGCVGCRTTFASFRVGPEGRPVPDVCPTCYPAAAPAEEPAAEPGKRSARMSENEVLDAMARAGFNVRKYRDFRLQTADWSDDPDALRAATRFIDDWEKGVDGTWAARPWAYLYGMGSRIDRGNVTIGKLGNGKTLWTWCVAVELLRRGLLQPGRFEFITVEKLFLRAEATFRSGSETSEAKILRHFASLDLLVLDELGVRKPSSSHAVRLLDEVTKDREGNGLIWTGNLSLAVIEEWEPGLKRITDRIAGEAGRRYIIPFRGRNKRLAGTSSAPAPLQAV